MNRAAVFAVLILAGCAPVPSYLGVPRLELVDAQRNVWRSAQPETAAQWVTIRSLGITTDVVFRTAGEWPDDPDDSLARSAGLEVVLVPMQPASVWGYFEAPTTAETELAQSALARGNAVGHCRWGHDRTGVEMAEYRVRVLGWTRAAAWDDALAHGLDPLLLGINGWAQDWLEGDR